MFKNWKNGKTIGYLPAVTLLEISGIFGFVVFALDWYHGIHKDSLETIIWSIM